MLPFVYTAFAATHILPLLLLLLITLPFPVWRRDRYVVWSHVVWLLLLAAYFAAAIGLKSLLLMGMLLLIWGEDM